MIRVKNNNKNAYLMHVGSFKSKKTGIALIVSALMCGGVATAYAANITNNAIATGKYDPGTPSDATDDVDASSNTAQENVPLVAKNAVMTMVAEFIDQPTLIKGDQDDVVDTGDTFKYKITITNTGNVTQTGIGISKGDLSFGTETSSNDAVGTLGDLTYLSGNGDQGDPNSDPVVLPSLEPSQVLVYTVEYTFDIQDSINAAGITDGLYIDPSVVSNEITGSLDDTLETTIAAVPKLEIAKTASLNDVTGGSSGFADLDETIDYTYTVENVGNVQVNDVQIEDEHQGEVLAGDYLPKNEVLTTGTTIGASSNATLNDGKIDLLDVGSTATFSVTVPVIQSDIDDQT